MGGVNPPAHCLAHRPNGGRRRNPGSPEHWPELTRHAGPADETKAELGFARRPRRGMSRRARLPARLGAVRSAGGRGSARQSSGGSRAKDQSASRRSLRKAETATRDATVSGSGAERRARSWSVRSIGRYADAGPGLFDPLILGENPQRRRHFVPRWGRAAPWLSGRYGWRRTRTSCHGTRTTVASCETRCHVTERWLSRAKGVFCRPGFRSWNAS